MDEKNSARELITDLKKFIVEKDILHDTDREISPEKMVDYLLAGIESNKDIQSGLYANVAKQGGFVRNMKNKIVTKVANITRNVIELPFMHQQKFNDSVYILLEYLVKENLALKEKLAKDGK